jgi:hypothetical protein
MMKMSVGDGNPLVPQVGPGNQNTSRHHLRLYTDRYIQMGLSIMQELLMSNKPHMGFLMKTPNHKSGAKEDWEFSLEIPLLEDN